MIRQVEFAKVLDNDDPANRGGLKVQCDALEEGIALRGGEYIPPCFPFAGAEVGWFFLPARGTLVEIEVESDPERATEELAARWRAVLYTDRDKIPAEFLSDQTNRAGLKWGSDLLLFDQTKGLVTLISANVRLGEEDASHPLVRGDTYNGELVTYLDAEDAFQALLSPYVAGWKAIFTAWKGLTPGTPLTTDALISVGNAMETPAQGLVTGIATYRTAISTFKAAKTTWLSTKCKTE